MSKRAALIITDARHVEVEELLPGGLEHVALEPSEQLLADLRILADPDWDGTWEDLKDAAARVRALLPKEGDG